MRDVYAAWWKYRISAQLFGEISTAKYGDGRAWIFNAALDTGFHKQQISEADKPTATTVHKFFPSVLHEIPFRHLLTFHKIICGISLI
jgi:hypothetical protein